MHRLSFLDSQPTWRHPPCSVRPTWIYLLAAFAVGLIPAVASGQSEAPRYSLASVLATAVEKNPDLGRAAIDIRRAEAARLEASGVDDWLLGANIGALINRNEAVGGNVTGTNAIDAYDVGASISRLLSTGGSVGLSFSGRRRDAEFTLSGSEITEYSGNLTFDFKQPLLRGRGSRVARASLRKTDLVARAAALERETQVRDVLRAVIHSYWDLALAWREIEIRRSTLALAEERKRITSAGIDAGTVSPTEGLAVEQVITTREEEILAAELAATRAALALRQVAFLPIDARNIDLKTADKAIASAKSLPEQQLIEQSLANSPEIAALTLRGEGATLDVEVAANGLLPRLDLALAFGPQGTAGTFSDAAETLGRFKGYQITAGLTYEQRLSARTAKGQREAARADAQRIQLGIADAKIQVAFAMASAIRFAQSAAQRMSLGQRTITLAERNIEAEQARFELGRATNFDVLQRQDELKQAQLRYARAAVDLLKAQATIDSLTGTLLDKYGVTVK